MTGIFELPKERQNDSKFEVVFWKNSRKIKTNLGNRVYFFCKIIILDKYEELFREI